METELPDNLETPEIQLLIDLCSYATPFLLNDAFAKFNHLNLSKLDFYVVFFGLQTLRLVCVEKLPPQMVNGHTNIMYRVTQYGREVVRIFKLLNKDYFQELV